MLIKGRGETKIYKSKVWERVRKTAVPALFLTGRGGCRTGTEKVTGKCNYLQIVLAKFLIVLYYHNQRKSALHKLRETI